jgi:hypothetical protein
MLMYTVEITLKNNPIALSVQRKEQENAEARKMLENAADSHTSGARCVRRCFMV